jgi:hypothetical protein
MNHQAIFLPVLVLVAHTFAVWCWMYVKRARALSSGEVSIQTYRDRNTMNIAVAAGSTTSDNLLNLFELPVLFYIAVLVLFQIQAVSSFYIWLAWGYSLLRIAHSLIHIGYNNIWHRFIAYFLSSCLLWTIWAGIAVRVLTT